MEQGDGEASSPENDDEEEVSPGILYERKRKANIAANAEALANLDAEFRQRYGDDVFDFRAAKKPRSGRKRLPPAQAGPSDGEPRRSSRPRKPRSMA